MKELITKWSINGRKLNNPFTILLRITLIIPIKILGYILFLMIWAAWGRYEADRILSSI
jgi:hypothetical protein